MWIMGIYVQRAVGVAVEHCLNGRKATSEYFKEPIFSQTQKRDSESEQEFTEEQKKQAQEKLLMQLKIMMSNFNTSKES